MNIKKSKESIGSVYKTKAVSVISPLQLNLSQSLKSSKNKKMLNEKNFIHQKLHKNTNIEASNSFEIPFGKNDIREHISEDEKILQINESFNKFIEDLQKIPNENQKFLAEYKFYTELLSKISSNFKPFCEILSTISCNLSKHFHNINLKQAEDYKQQNKKLIQKLKTLSEENIEFLKKNENLKNEISLIKKSIVYNETQSIENLVQELIAKNNYSRVLLYTFHYNHK